MITFRDVVRRESTDEKLTWLRACIQLRDTEGVFTETGELEQALIDALRPERDGWGELERLLRRLMCAAARIHVADRAGRTPLDFTEIERLAEAVGRVAPFRWLEVRVPEGYFHYGLDPLGYARAAATYVRERGRRRSANAVVLGVRSIGTGLSAIVAGELGTRRTATIRARGASGERRIVAEPSLCTAVREWLRDGGDAVVVDEGPGATGETFAVAAQWLHELGLPAARIALFTSHRKLPSLADERRREFFGRVSRYSPPDADDRVADICRQFDLSDPSDLSRGRWRELRRSARRSPVVPQHERPKFRAPGRTGSFFLIRYAGLGRAGMELATRARCLASAGFGPEPVGRSMGFLVSDWIDGSIPPLRSLRMPAFVTRLADYLAARIVLFATGETVNIGPILEMLRQNAEEVSSPAPTGLGAALNRLERLPAREAVVADARLQPIEWVLAGDRYVKLDALDHGDGIRLPGPVDPAWDIAAAGLELRLTPSALELLVRRCGERLPGGARELAQAVEAYRPAYLACRLGELVVSAREAAGAGEDATDLRRCADHCTRWLAWELARSRGAPSARRVS